MDRFREFFGFKQAILHHIFKKMILSKSNKYSPIYETSLKLFEVCVEAIKNRPIIDAERKDNVESNDGESLQELCDKFDTQKTNPLDELQAIFDFVIDQDYSTANGKSTEHVETTVKVAIDILTIVFIHIIVSHYKAGRRS